MYTFRRQAASAAHTRRPAWYHSRLNNLAIDSGAGDIITVEWYDELDAAISNVENAHKGGKIVAASWCTDGKLCAECVQHKLEEMLESQAEMLELGAVCADRGNKGIP